MAPQALPNCFTVALGLCHVPSLFTHVCMGISAHTCPFCATPLCLCTMIKGGSARQGLSSGMGIVNQSMEEGEHCVPSVGL